MCRPFERYDAIKVKGIDRLLSITDVHPDYERDGWIVEAEDVETLQKVITNADDCIFIMIGQLDMFERNELCI